MGFLRLAPPLLCWAQEKSNRAVALDCLHRLVHFYLQVYAQAQPKSRVWEKLEVRPHEGRKSYTSSGLELLFP